jgi:YidC/Oxa1 family membrane protein insertase
MPLMFGFFSLQFPSGLSIYFILANVIGIAQGWYTRRIMEKEKAELAAAKPVITASPNGTATSKSTKPASSTQSSNGSSGSKSSGSKSSGSKSSSKRKRSAKR